MILTHLVFFQFLGGASPGGVTPPTPDVGVTIGRDGSGKRKASFRYDRWGRKKKQALKKSPEAVQIIEQVAEAYVEAPDYSWLASAIQALEKQLAAEHIKASRVYIELLELERARLEYEEDEDDELLLS